MEGVFAGRGGKVIVKTANQEEADRLMEKGITGFSLRKPDEVRARVVVRDVPGDVAAEETFLLEEIRSENFPNVTADDLRNGLSTSLDVGQKRKRQVFYHPRT